MSSVEVIDIDDSDDDMGSERTAQKCDTTDHFEPISKMVDELTAEIESLRQFFDSHRLTASQPDTESAADNVINDDQPKAVAFVQRLTEARVIKLNDKLLFKCFDCCQMFATDDHGFRRLREHYVCDQLDCRFRATRGCRVTHHMKICGIKTVLTSTANNTENNCQNGVSTYLCDYVECGQIFLTETQLKNHQCEEHVFDKPYNCDNYGSVLANNAVNIDKHWQKFGNESHNVDVKMSVCDENKQLVSLSSLIESYQV